MTYCAEGKKRRGRGKRGAWSPGHAATRCKVCHTAMKRDELGPDGSHSAPGTIWGLANTAPSAGGCADTSQVDSVTQWLRIVASFFFFVLSFSLSFHPTLVPHSFAGLASSRLVDRLLSRFRRPVSSFWLFTHSISCSRNPRITLQREKTAAAPRNLVPICQPANACQPMQ